MCIISLKEAVESSKHRPVNMKHCHAKPLAQLSKHSLQDTCSHEAKSQQKQE